MTTFQISLVAQDAFAEFHQNGRPPHGDLKPPEEFHQNGRPPHGDLKPPEEIAFLSRFPLATLCRLSS